MVHIGAKTRHDAGKPEDSISHLLTLRKRRPRWVEHRPLDNVLDFWYDYADRLWIDHYKAISLHYCIVCSHLIEKPQRYARVLLW